MIDEADRIMEHVKQDWLSHVENAVFSGGRTAPSSLNVYRQDSLTVPVLYTLKSSIHVFMRDLFLLN